MQQCTVQPVTVLASLSDVKRPSPFTSDREIRLEGFDFDGLRRVADCIVFCLEVTVSAAYPYIIWERAEGFDIRWIGEPPAELTDRPITVAGMSFALQRTEVRLRVAWQPTAWRVRETVSVR